MENIAIHMKFCCDTTYTSEQTFVFDANTILGRFFGELENHDTVALLCFVAILDRGVTSVGETHTSAVNERSDDTEERMIQKLCGKKQN